MEYLTYDIDGISILLPDEHLLPVYQKTHSLYDKLPRFIVRNIPSGGNIIEVGANVGDTLASMLSVKNDAKYFCIEGDELFFSYLELNTSILEKDLELRHGSINIEKIFIASKLEYSAFVGSGGTRSGIIYEPDSEIPGEKIQTISLDDYIENSGIKAVELIIVDVDGFDFDVIQSAIISISKYKPLIYFELTPNDPSIIQSYMRVIKKLQRTSYVNFFVFDNFGNFLFDCSDLVLLEQFCNYVLRQNMHIGTRTIYYLDILAVPKSKKDIGSKILRSFLEDCDHARR